jgi:hypothetical protein
MVRKMLIAPNVARDSQQNKLFCTRCAINNNLFDLILNSVSCENIIDKHIVDKLKFPLEPYPEPYKIGWIKTIEEIRITQRCKYLFPLKCIWIRFIVIW